ncbi:MAG TPA: LPS export ABC transporter periplasmic protein LptC [Gallionellaceae bacterium]|nr:LPS export ABC transporter periplasmic protein LptC [Gallionellaceae bacterium]
MTPPTLLDRLRAWSALVPLLALLAATYWLSQQVLPLPPAPDYKARHDPDVIITDFSAVALGNSGAPRYLLAAREMKHYPDDNSTDLIAPRLTSPFRNAPPIRITADRGTVDHNGSEIFLHDNVVIVRDASAKQGQMKITTSYLHVAPNDETADTDRPVTITTEHSLTTAKGLTLNSATRVLTLLAQVRAQYEPPQD